MRPFSFAPFSITCLEMRIWVTAERMLKATVTRMIPSAGITSAGAKEKICVTYSRDIRDVSPVEKTFPMSREHS